MSCGGDHFYTGDAGRFVGEEVLPDLVAPRERGPVPTYLLVTWSQPVSQLSSKGTVRSRCPAVGPKLGSTSIDNIVADALSRRYEDIEPEPAFLSYLRPDLSSREEAKPSETRILHAMSAVQNNFCDQVRAAQLLDPTESRTPRKDNICVSRHSRFQ